ATRTALPPTAGRRKRSPSAPSKDWTARSASCSGAPTACATRSTCGSRSSPPCCPSCERLRPRSLIVAPCSRRSRTSPCEAALRSILDRRCARRTTRCHGNDAAEWSQALLRDADGAKLPTRLPEEALTLDLRFCRSGSHSRWENTPRTPYADAYCCCSRQKLARPASVRRCSNSVGFLRNSGRAGAASSTRPRDLERAAMVFSMLRYTESAPFPLPELRRR